MLQDKLDGFLARVTVALSLVQSYNANAKAIANAKEVCTSNANPREIRHAGAVQVLFPRLWTENEPVWVFFTLRLRFPGSRV